MNLKTKKTLLLVLPLVAGGILIYAINRNKNKPSTKPNGQAKPATPPKTTSDFPIKVGSRGDKVKELQTAIGFKGSDVDGIFGSDTLAALKDFAGISQVADQASLDQIKKKATGVSNASLAENLLSQFQKGEVAVYTRSKITIAKVQEDVNGALLNTGTFITMAASKTYNNSDYKLVGTTKLGNLELQITSGALAGLYVVDPNTITLVSTPSANTDTTAYNPVGAGGGF
jgi:lysozyme family protein